MSKDPIITSPKYTYDASGGDAAAAATRDASGNAAAAARDASGNAAASKTYSSPLSSTLSSENLKNKVFTATNFLYFVWFLGVFLIIYFLFIPNKSENGRLLNIILIVWLIYLCSYLYFQMTDYERAHLYHTSLEWTQEYFNNDMELLYLVIYTIIFYALIYLLQVPMDHDNKPFMVGLLEDKFWILIIMFVVLIFFKYVFGINLNDLFFEYYYKAEHSLVKESKTAGDKLKNTIIPGQRTDVSGGRHGTVATTGKAGEEVFNIDNNLYSYSDAQAICKSYGARLATYDDIEKSYMDGAEWCSYGWSEGQMAYFPTQKATWEKLQQNPKYKNQCGRPGVNGGYMANPDLKFGVNCYGVKPKPSQRDLDLMNARKQSVVPKSDEDVAMEQKVNYWKTQNIALNSYNTDHWSKY